LGAFEYTAVDAAGRERKGVLEGDTARQVRQLLRDQALLPLAVSEVSQTEQKQSDTRFTIKRGVSAARSKPRSREFAAS
jgi:general secretion pathway protein F